MMEEQTDTYQPHQFRVVQATRRTFRIHLIASRWDKKDIVSATVAPTVREAELGKLLGEAR